LNFLQKEGISHLGSGWPICPVAVAAESRLSTSPGEGRTLGGNQKNVVGVGKSLTNCCGFFIYFVNWFLKRLYIKVPGWVEKNITVSGRPPRRLAQRMQALRLILVAVFRQLKIKTRRKFAELRNTGQQSNLATMY
jgi:hypothetical protein